MDRRALFFVIAAIACAVLVPATDSDLRWVPIAMTIAYVVLALLSLLDARSRHRAPREGAGPPDEVSRSGQ